MTSLHRPARLALRPLEERATPATAVYSALTQVLTVTAAQGDNLVVAAVPNKPTGYLTVTETQANFNVFNSDARNQAVRGIVVQFGNTTAGTLTLDATTRIGGGLVVNGGLGVTTVNLAGTVGGNVTVAANPLKDLAATEVVNLEPTAAVGGSVRLALGGGDNIVRLRGGTVRGNLGMSASGGEDTVHLTELADLTVNGAMAFNLGDGTNTVVGVGTRMIRVGAGFAYTGGIGNDTFDLDGSGTALDVRGDARFTLGTPVGFDANVAKFEALAARNIGFVGGAGSDAIEVSGGLMATGNMGISPGHGENSFTSNLLGGGTNTIGGSFIYTGGANGDAVSLDNTTIGRGALVSLGDAFGTGVSTLSAGTKGPGGVTVYGNLKVTAGPTSGSTVQLARLYVGGGLTVLGGATAGDNAVWMDDVNVAGATLIDLGTGADSVWLEQLGGNNGGPLGAVSTFGGTFTIKGGIGDDTVTLAANGIAGQQAQFGGRVILVGGAGADSLTVGTGISFEHTSNFEDFESGTGDVA
jgi:hypothetical protein